MRKSVWLTALILAVTLHAAAFLVYMQKPQPVGGAKAEGVAGVVVNLGLLGNELDKKVVKKKKPKPKPKKIKQKKKKRKPKPKPKPKVKEVVKPLQKTAVVVKETIPEKVVEKIVSTPLPVVVEPAEPTPEPVAQDSAPDVSEAVQQEYQKTSGIGQDASAGGQVSKRIAYTGKLLAKIKKYKRYPRFSRRRHEEGIVKLNFRLDRSGKVLSFEIAESSGYERLDKEVLRMLKKASPFPPFPKEMTQEMLVITVPISFNLR